LEFNLPFPRAFLRFCLVVNLQPRILNICYESVNIRGRKYLWYRFFKRANSFHRVCLFDFIQEPTRVCDKPLCSYSPGRPERAKITKTTEIIILHIPKTNNIQ